MDNLQWLEHYRPLADETLDAKGDTEPLANRLRQCAAELRTLRNAGVALLERAESAESKLDRAARLLNDSEKRLSKLQRDYDNVGRKLDSALKGYLEKSSRLDWLIRNGDCMLSGEPGHNAHECEVCQAFDPSLVEEGQASGLCSAHQIPEKGCRLCYPDVDTSEEGE